jgi:hypothetical protein
VSRGQLEVKRVRRTYSLHRLTEESLLLDQDQLVVQAPNPAWIQLASRSFRFDVKRQTVRIFPKRCKLSLPDSDAYAKLQAPTSDGTTEFIDNEYSHTLRSARRNWSS